MGRPDRLLALLAVLGIFVPTQAVPKSYFYSFGIDAGDTQLLPMDDISSPEKALRAPIIYFGQIYYSIFVSRNTNFC